MLFLFYFALGILLVMLLHTLLRSYMRTAPHRVKTLGGWLAGIGLVLASIFSPALRKLAFIGLLFFPWWQRGENAAPRSRSRMSEVEAREVLGVGQAATPEEIEEAYRHLMRLSHPDQGGSEYFAKKLNEARDVLLKGKP